MPDRRAPAPPGGDRQGVAPVVEAARIDPGGELGRGAWFLIGGACLLVLVAILKPWDARPPASGASPARTTTAEALAGAAPQPAAAADPSETPAARCNRPLGWRVYSLAEWRGEPVRTFVAVEPIAGWVVDGAGDPAIPVVPVYGETISGIGFCASILPERRPPAGIDVELWRVRPDGEVDRIRPRRLEPLEPTSMGGLYGRRTGELRDDRRPPWPDGRYAFHLVGPADSGFDIWFAVEVDPDR